jgi:methyl-accepting chemotaxis protein
MISIGIIAGFTVLFYLVINFINTSSTRLQTEKYSSLNHLQEYISQADYIKSNLLNFTSDILPGPGIATKNNEALPRLDKALQEYLLNYKPNEEEKVLLDKIVKSHPGFIELIKNSSMLANEHKKDDVVEILEDDWVDYTIELFKPTQKLLQGLNQSVKVETELVRKNNDLVKNSVAVIGFILILLITIFSFFIIKVIFNQTNKIKSDLDEITAFLSDVSIDINSFAQKLSEASSEQAAALQQTSSSLTEISTMVEKNTDIANSSSKMAITSEHKAEEGMTSVSKVNTKINEINKSNVSLTQSIEDNNSEIEKIITVINDISDKTKVINDIVFQTKLLSFNASVEAARAGENGKGFAVVAEEVGNLATMSGNASQEISDLLQKSIDQVNSSIEKSKSNTEASLKQSAEKVKEGVIETENCSKILNEIVNNFKEVNVAVKMVADSSIEQSSGVSQITNAVTGLDDSARINLNISEDIQVQSQLLNQYSEKVTEITAKFNQIVYGGKDPVQDASIVDEQEEFQEI